MSARSVSDRPGCGRRNPGSMETAVSTRQDPDGTSPGDRYLHLELLVSRNLSRFCWKAYQQLGNVHDAEDAVQDALLSAYQHLSEFEGRSRLSTWLTSIVINAARCQLRRKRASKSLIEVQSDSEDDKIPLAETIADERPGPHEIFSDAENHRLIAESIRQLSAPLRKTLLLYYFDGLTTSEVAGVLGIPVGTVKARIFRARMRLKRTVRLESRPG